MQLLITFTHPRLAQAFVDYMATHQVEITLKQHNEQIELWLNDPSQLNFVQQELPRFLADPMNERYRAASWQTGNINNALPYQKGDYWQIIRSRAGTLTLTVMALCILIYLLEMILGIPQLMAWLAFPEDSSQYLQLWRWFTPALLHFSAIHIGFNLVLWWYIGGPVERKLGLYKLLQILLLSGLLSNYVQSLFSHNLFGGLSGVVYGLVGYAWLMGHKAPEKGIQLDNSLMMVSFIWLFVGYFDILGLPIANAAHATGLITGLLLAAWDANKARSKEINR